MNRYNHSLQDTPESEVRNSAEVSEGSGLDSEREPVAWAQEIIDDLIAQHDTEMIAENDSGDALVRLDGAIAAVQDAAGRHAPTPHAEPPEDVVRLVEELRGCASVAKPTDDGVTYGLAGMCIKASKALTRLAAERDELLALLEEARGNLADWCYNFEGGGDPESTQFSFCRECGVVEYLAHKKDCAHVERIARIDAALARGKEGT